MFRNARFRARRKGVPFTIVRTDIHIPELCPVFGHPLRCFLGKQAGGPWSPSLDRIIPAKGYVPGNIMVVSKKFNVIKSNATPDELGIAAMFMLKLADHPQEIL